MTRRVAIAGFWHETNTYSSRATTLDSFEQFELLQGDEIVEHHRGLGSVVGGFLDNCPGTPVGALSTGAWPSGPADASTVNHLLDRLREALQRAAPLDGVLINLHGAMVGQGIPDVEAAVLTTIRQTVGDVPIAAVLDLHGNPSPALTEATDIVLAYDTSPHIDMRERGQEAARLLGDALEGRRLQTHLAKLPLLTCPLGQGSDDHPMQTLFATARDLEDRLGLARISLLPGFAYSDVERAGFSILAIADASREDAALEALRGMCAAVAAREDDFRRDRPCPEEAVRQAKQAHRGPVVLADVADNVGGGSPGDGTVLLAELLKQHVSGAVVTLADAEVAHTAAQAGNGTVLNTAIGGKTDTLHGAPVSVEATVETVTDGRYRTAGTWMTGQEFSMGTTAVLRANGVRIVVTSRATPPFHREQLTSVGIDPAACTVIVAKGAVAWRAAYGDVAAHVIEVDTPGCCPIDVNCLQRDTDPMTLTPDNEIPR